MTDVAKRAGVAQSTVSYVINGNRSISDATRMAVERAMRELGYTPNAAAQALRGERSATLVLSAPGTSPSLDFVVGVYFLEIAAAARRYGYDLLIATESDDAPDAVLRALRSGRADAAILMLGVVPYEPRIARIEASGLKAVVLGEPEPHGSLPFVDYDLAEGGAAAVDILADAGHRSILHVGWTDDEEDAGLLYTRRARSGIDRAAAARGCTVTHIRASRDARENDARIGIALSSDAAPTAMICSHLGTFNAARSAFLQKRPDAHEQTAVIALGALGRHDSPGSDATRMECSVTIAADHLVRLAVDLINDKPTASVKLIPQLKESAPAAAPA